MTPLRDNRLILIVLYNTPLSASQTVRSIVAARFVLGARDHVVLWDNSPTAQEAREHAWFGNSYPHSWEYVHTPENRSLACIYNTCISQQPDFSHVAFFDQDSAFTATYFEAANAAAAANPDINLFAPLIRSEERIVSPGHFFYFKGKYWTRPRWGRIPARNTVAVMSGLYVRMDYLKRFGGFDERLSLYGIDTNFMIRYSRGNNLLYVLDTPFDHELSQFADEGRAARRRRFENFKQASRINATLFPQPVRWLTNLYLLYRTLTF